MHENSVQKRGSLCAVVEFLQMRLHVDDVFWRRMRHTYYTFFTFFYQQKIFAEKRFSVDQKVETLFSAGTTYLFESSSAIFYEYPSSLRPSTGLDTVVLGFQTRMATGVLLAVQCSVDGDFLTIYLVISSCFSKTDLSVSY